MFVDSNITCTWPRRVQSSSLQLENMWFVTNYSIPDFNILSTVQSLRFYRLSVRVPSIVSGMSCDHNLKRTFLKLFIYASAYGMSCSCGWMRQPPGMNGSYEYTEKIIADCQKGVIPYLEVCIGNLQIPNKKSCLP